MVKAKKTIKTKRFIDNKDGTVSDNETGLMWAQEGSPERLTFKEAEKYYKELNLGKHKDWRLPTLKELISIVDYDRISPSIDPIFKAESSWYWSATGYAGGSDGAWIVGFGGGNTYWDYRDDGYYVRPVRQY